MTQDEWLKPCTRYYTLPSMSMPICKCTVYGQTENNDFANVQCYGQTENNDLCSGQNPAQAGRPCAI